MTMKVKLVFLATLLSVKMVNHITVGYSRAASQESSTIAQFCLDCIKRGGPCVFEDQSQRCFAFERHEPMAWHEANDWCKKENFTGLARLISRYADGTVKDFLKQHNWHYGNSFAYWVGGQYEKHRDHWQWNSQRSTPMKYMNWEVRLPGYKAQPDDPFIDKCVDVELRYFEDMKEYYGWYDTKCEYNQYFICELTNY